MEDELDDPDVPEPHMSKKNATNFYGIAGISNPGPATKPTESIRTKKPKNSRTEHGPTVKKSKHKESETYLYPDNPFLTESDTEDTEELPPTRLTPIHNPYGVPPKHSIARTQ